MDKIHQAAVKVGSRSRLAFGSFSYAQKKQSWSGYCEHCGPPEAAAAGAPLFPSPTGMQVAPPKAYAGGTPYGPGQRRPQGPEGACSATALHPMHSRQCRHRTRCNRGFLGAWRRRRLVSRACDAIILRRQRFSARRNPYMRTGAAATKTMAAAADDTDLTERQQGVPASWNYAQKLNNTATCGLGLSKLTSTGIVKAYKCGKKSGCAVLRANRPVKPREIRKNALRTPPVMCGAQPQSHIRHAHTKAKI